MGVVDDFPSLRAALSVGHGALVPWQHLLPVDGAKIGKGAQLNTDNINDAGMVTLGEGVVMGGHATINAHLTEKGELVLSPVRVGDGALLGTGSIVQPGCEIGAGAVVASRAVVPKWTKIPPGEVWAGIPAKCIRLADGTKPGD